MMFVMAWLLVEDATIIGGSFCLTAASIQRVATTERISVVFPVPGGPLTANISPSSIASACVNADLWAGANA